MTATQNVVKDKTNNTPRDVVSRCCGWDRTGTCEDDRPANVLENTSWVAFMKVESYYAFEQHKYDIS